MPLLTKEQIETAVLELSPLERRELAEFIVSSLHNEGQESADCRERMESYHGHVPSLTDENEEEFSHQIEALA